MSGRIPEHLLAWVVTQPWAIAELPAREYLRVLNRRGDGPEAVAERLGRPLDGTRMVKMRDGVALLPVSGPIFRYADRFVEVSGGVSIEALALDLSKAASDPAVRAIVLDVDSPGGQLSGINEFANQVAAANRQKPVWAYVGGAGSSGAYMIAAAAGRIVCDATATLGSIGVVMTATDDTPQSREGGPKQYRFVSSQSPNKRPDLETEAGRAGMQAFVDGLGQVFVEAVAGHRRVTVDHVLQRFGKGGLLVGADAVAAGMADALGSLESVVHEIVNAMPGRKATAPPIGATDTMYASSPLATDAAALPVEQRCQAQWDRDPSIRAEFGSLGAFTAYVRAEERSRVSSAASRTARSPTPDMPVEQRCRAQWDRDPAIRAEFGSLETFIAFTAADERGAVRIRRTS